MEKVKELAAQYQQAGNNCAETVVKVCNDCLDLKLPPETLRMVSVRRRGGWFGLYLRGLEWGLPGPGLSCRPDDARRKDESRNQSACTGISENLARPL